MGYTQMPAELSVSFRNVGFCLALFRLLFPPAHSHNRAMSLPMTTAAVFITGCPVWARDWHPWLVLGSLLVQGHMQSQRECLSSQSGPHFFFFSWGPNCPVGSEPQHFKTLLGSPGLTPSPASTETSRSIFYLRGVKPGAKEWTGSDVHHSHRVSLVPSYSLPAQTPLFSPLKSGLPTAGEDSVRPQCLCPRSAPNCFFHPLPG